MYSYIFILGLDIDSVELRIRVNGSTGVEPDDIINTSYIMYIFIYNICEYRYIYTY